MYAWAKDDVFVPATGWRLLLARRGLRGLHSRSGLHPCKSLRLSPAFRDNGCVRQHCGLIGSPLAGPRLRHRVNWSRRRLRGLASVSNSSSASPLGGHARVRLCCRVSGEGVPGRSPSACTRGVLAGRATLISFYAWPVQCGLRNFVFFQLGSWPRGGRCRA